MEIKGIDVSAWQGKIDWKTVADYGMGFAILRITEAGNVVDSQFENNLAGVVPEAIRRRWTDSGQSKSHTFSDDCRSRSRTSPHCNR